MKYVSICRVVVEIWLVVSYTKTVESIDCDDRLFQEEEGVQWRYALEGEFPWMVSLQHTGESIVSHFCGGSLAAANLVLTACHCLVIHSVVSGDEKPFLTDTSSKVVVAGSLNNNRSDPNHFRVTVGISRFIIHPKCRHFNHHNPEDRGGWDFDFGLVVLKRSLTLDGKHLAAFRLFAWDEFTIKRDLEHRMADHIECVATGWGKRHVRNYNGTEKDLLEYDPRAFWPQLSVLQVKLDDFAACYNIMCGFDKVYCKIDHWGRDQLCATAEGHLEVCYGDSVPSIEGDIIGYVNISGDSKIIGGQVAQSGEFQWMVSLQYAVEGSHYCGGVLLTLSKVLTTCHCVAFYKDDNEEELFPLHDKLIMAGSVSNIVNPKDLYQQIRRPIKATVHPMCRSRRRGGFLNDYGVLKPNKPFVTSLRVAPAALISTVNGVTWRYMMNLINQKRWCSAVGWGMTNFTSRGNMLHYSDPSRELKKIGVELVSFSECKHLLQTFDHIYSRVKISSKYQVCTLNRDNYDVCKGDSGGGLICGQFVYGILSWGPACGKVNVPSMFAVLDGSWDLVFKPKPNVSMAAKAQILWVCFTAAFTISINAILNT